MNHHKINKDSKKKILKFIFIGVFSVLIITTISLNLLSKSSNKYINDLEESQNKYLSVETTSSVKIKKDKNRLNILIAGIGGEGHEGGMLTDSIMLMSINTQTNKAATLTIPRDLYVNLGDDLGYWKINHANAFGENKKPGQGMQLLQSTLENILAQEIKYYVRIDFSGFEKIIDILGGIEISVDKEFIDTQYPTENFGYETIKFETGLQTMDGATALKYTRSRHGNNGEGSDFARSKRQQKVLIALKEKIFSFNSLLNPAKLISLVSELKKNISTNISYKDISSLYKLSSKISSKDMINKSLSESSGYVYVTKTLDGSSIIKPIGNNFDMIRNLVENIFTSDKDDLIEKYSEKLPKIVILNGTNTIGLANKITEEIKNLQEFNIYHVGNYEKRNIDQTILYDTSEKASISKISILNTKFNAKTMSKRVNIFNSYSNDIILQTDEQIQKLDNLKKLYSGADIVLILGQDFKESM